MVVFFNSFGVEYIPQDVLNKINLNKYITQNIFRIQSNDISMCGFYCIAFIKYMIYLSYICFVLIKFEMISLN